MKRRQFNLQLAAGLGGTLPLVGGAPAMAADMTAPADAPWAAIETRSGGRLGAAVLLPTGTLLGHRLDERFPMCSTFKWLAAAYVLHRVDAGKETLQRRIRWGREALLPHSPVTARHVGEGLTLAQLCHAAITQSDNAAANLILATYGGPQALTQYARSLGDEVTRLDRVEPELNEAAPGDPRDTTSPRAMARLLHAALVGDALSVASRARLARWMQACETNGQRLRAALPPGWRMGSKTGTGERGATNDVGIFWPPGRPPVIAAVYVCDTQAPQAERNAAVAGVARYVHRL